MGKILIQKAISWGHGTNGKEVKQMENCQRLYADGWTVNQLAKKYGSKEKVKALLWVK